MKKYLEIAIIIPLFVFWLIVVFPLALILGVPLNVTARKKK